MIYVFFFQAEDGIRDHCVTGVQTCALPIYGGNMNKNERSLRSMVENLPLDQALEYIVSELGTYMTTIQTALELLDKAHPELRSEERRVGKECRSRWEQYR